MPIDEEALQKCIETQMTKIIDTDKQLVAIGDALEFNNWFEPHMYDETNHTAYFNELTRLANTLKVEELLTSLLNAIRWEYIHDYENNIFSPEVRTAFNSIMIRLLKETIADLKKALFKGGYYDYQFLNSTLCRTSITVQILMNFINSYEPPGRFLSIFKTTGPELAALNALTVKKEGDTLISFIDIRNAVLSVSKQKHANSNRTILLEHPLYYNDDKTGVSNVTRKIGRHFRTQVDALFVNPDTQLQQSHT